MKNVMNMLIHLICLMDDRKKELTDAVDCPEHNELFWFEPSEFKSTIDALNGQNI